MRNNKFSLVSVVALSTLVASCGGNGGAGNLAPKIQFSSQVVFGDSLSDVGTYAVGGVAALGGGRYTVNSMVGGELAKTNWTELMASVLNQSVPCPAETGLNGAAMGFNVPPVFHTPACTNYAQGGAMVTYQYGVGNASVLPIPNGNPDSGSAALGQLTVPIVTQINNHLAAHGGSFSGSEIVFLLAGGNDALFNLALVANGHATPQAAVQAMAQAGAEMTGYINNLILANGAKYVVVLNLPDLSTTPFIVATNQMVPGIQSLVSTMVQTFNAQLQAGLTSPNVLLVDAYGRSVDQIVQPAIYGLTNVTSPACDLSAPSNPLESSLTCNVNNVVPGDVSHYEFADGVHPTPYGNVLIARYVSSQMAIKGWL